MKNNLRSKIFKYATNRNMSGVTAYEVATKFNVSRSTASAALSEMSNRGLLIRGDARRRVATGRANVIYFR